MNKRSNITIEIDKKTGLIKVWDETRTIFNVDRIFMIKDVENIEKSIKFNIVIEEL